MLGTWLATEIGNERGMFEVSSRNLRLFEAKNSKYRFPDTRYFPEAQEPWFRERVEFWIRIFTRLNSFQGVIHDAAHPHLVFEILDLRRFTSKKDEDEYIKERKAYWNNLLGDIGKNRVLEAFQDSKNKMLIQKDYVNLAKFGRVRFQRGMRDRFRSAAYRAQRYLPIMEKVFRDQGLPVELSRLPYVESSFDFTAYSKVGASGIWQFMRFTGERFLEINDAVDNRLDPVRSTVAASMLLKENYEILGTWPLAVTAYNYGASGLLRAKRRLKTASLKVIIQKFRDGRFGFASRNFYIELLAAIEVDLNLNHYFRDLPNLSKLAYVEVDLPHFVYISDFLDYVDVDHEEFKSLNPSLLPSVYKEKKRIPAGHLLRIPAGSRENPRGTFERQYMKIPRELKFNSQK